MKIVLGGVQLKTPDASTISITNSMSDAIPKCNINIADNTSSLSITCPQEIIVLDDQIIPNPTINMLQNPTLNPYNSLWFQYTAVTGVTMSAVGGGGVQYTFNNAANGANQLEYQYTPQAAIVGGQTYVYSMYVIGVAPVNVQMALAVGFVDASNNGTGNFVNYYPITTTLTRISMTIVAPANSSFAGIEFSPITTSATNSGTVTITNVQFEPQWFSTQSYPTPFCGPSQTNCVQLPSGQWIRQYRKFAGFVINTINSDYHGNVRTIQIQAVGYAWLMGTIYSNKSYTNTYDNAIIANLLSTYLTSTDPRSGTSYNMLTTTYVVQGVQLSNFAIPWDDLKTVHDNLASQIGFYWTVDYYWNMVFAPPGYFTSPNSLILDNSVTPNMTTTFPAYAWSSESDFTQPGSNILVLGSGSNAAQVIDPVQINNIGNTCGYFLPTNTSWMRKVNQSSLNSVSDCTTRGIAEIIQYNLPRGVYHLTTDACELVAGQAISITSATDGLNNTALLLQSVTATWLGVNAKLADVWEYTADLGAVNRQVQHIMSRLFRSTNSNTTATAIASTALVAFERLGVTDTASTSSTLATGYQVTIMNDAPIAYYRLDEQEGTVADDFSGNAYQGTLHGGITLGTAGLLHSGGDTAMTFNGSTGYISLPTSFIPTSAAHAWSLECWCKVSSFGTGGAYGMMAGMGTGATHSQAMILSHDNSGQAVFVLSTSGGDIASGTVLTNTIYHVVGTYDGTNLRLYVNNVLVAGPTAVAVTLGTNFAGIGAGYAGGTNFFFNGIIDEPAFYNFTLSTTQINNHYTAGTA